MRSITYCIDKHSGFVYSRVRDEVAFPVLEYDKMEPENGFRMSYRLMKGNVHDVLRGHEWGDLKWTKKIKRPLKNRHRKFWGM